MEVPALAGLDLDEAGAELARRQLVLGEATSAPSEAPARSIIAQGLDAGARVRKQSVVSVQVAMPIPAITPDRVAVPEVAGLSRSEAEETLVSARLRPGRVEEVDRFEAPAGVVLEQRPRGQLVPVGTPVDLWVASPWTVVPALGGMSLEAARVALAARRLVVGDSRSEFSDAPAGSVLAQSPVAGSRVLKESAVDVVLAQAAVAAPPGVTGLPQDSILVDPVPPAAPGRVPSVIGLSLAEARARLDSAGLALVLGEAVRRSGLPAQLVAAQEPAANSALPPDGIVRLQLATSFPWAQVLGVAVIALTLVTLAAPRIRAWLAKPRGAQEEGAGARPPDVDFSPVLDNLTADLRSGTLVSPHALEMVAVLEELRSEPVYADTLTRGGRDEH